MEPIEVLSLEAGVLQVLSVAIGLLLILRVFGILFTNLIPRLDGFVSGVVTFFFETGKSLPLFLGSFFVAVAAPVFELYMDSDWILGLLKEGALLETHLPVGHGESSPNWLQLLFASDQVSVSANLTHSLQIAILVGFLWLFFMTLNFFLKKIEEANSIQAQNFVRIGVLLMALVVVQKVVSFLGYLGQHPIFVG